MTEAVPFRYRGTLPDGEEAGVPRLKLMIMSFGAFWAMLYATLYLWKTWGYQHSNNSVANSLVAVS